MGGSRSPTYSVIVFLVVALLLAVTGDFIRLEVDGTVYWHTADDHMITQRVAYMFHTTGAPYINPGEPVAAATSLFWPIMLSPLYYVFDLQEAVAATIAFSIGLSAASAALAAGLLDRAIDRMIAAVAICLTPSLANYGATGWEHIPTMFVFTWAFVLIARASDASGRLDVPYPALLLAAAGFAFRPDAAIAVAVLVLAHLATNQRYRRAASYIAVSVLLVVPASYLWLMSHYFGDIVPNTAYLKSPGDRLWEMNAAYFTSLRLSGMAPLLIILNLLMFRVWRPWMGLVIGIALAHTAYVASVGGDTFEAGRFFVFLLPTLVVMTFLNLTALTRQRAATRKSLILAAVSLAGLLIWHGSYVSRGILFSEGDPEVRDKVYLLRSVHAIRTHLDPMDGAIGMHWLGMSYHLPEFRIVDFLGKADPHIARLEPRNLMIGHNKWDYDYSFGAAPIAASFMASEFHRAANTPDLVDQLEPNHFWSAFALWMSGQDGYVFVPSERIGNGPTGFGLYLRNDLAPELTQG